MLVASTILRTFNLRSRYCIGTCGVTRVGAIGTRLCKLLWYRWNWCCIVSIRFSMLSLNWVFFSPKLRLDEHKEFLIHFRQNSRGCLLSVADQQKLNDVCTFNQDFTELNWNLKGHGLIVPLSSMLQTLGNNLASHINQSVSVTFDYTPNSIPMALPKKTSGIFLRLSTSTNIHCISNSTSIAFSRLLPKNWQQRWMFAYFSSIITPTFQMHLLCNQKWWRPLLHFAFRCVLLLESEMDDVRAYLEIK